MVLLLQLNGDLPEHFPGHERRLYVFTCRRKTCRRKDGSIRAIRGVRSFKTAGSKPAEAEVKPEPQVAPKSTPLSTQLGESLFGVKPAGSVAAPRNPFSTTASASSSSNPFSAPSASSSNPFSSASQASSIEPPQAAQTSALARTFASALSINNDNNENTPTYGPSPPAEPWPQESELPKAYPRHYLVDADYETLDKIVDMPVQNIKMEVDEEPGSSSQKEDKSAYEDKIDRQFQKFADRMAQNSEQVIRYEFRGQPLLYSTTDAVGKLLSPSSKDGRIPACRNCGSRRVFEVQITPHTIIELEAEHMSLEGMDWGTIIIGVCDKDCSPRGTAAGELGYLEEWAGVQWEELKA
jgi:pre-rRNA-processing protein TSR4